MRKKYEIFLAAQEELNEQIKKHAERKLNYSGKELEAFQKGCNYILFRIRNNKIDPAVLENTAITNTKLEE